MSTLLEQQKQAAMDVSEAEHKKSIMVGVGTLFAGGALWAFGFRKAAAVVAVTGSAAQWYRLGKAEMAAELAEKL